VSQSVLCRWRLQTDATDEAAARKHLLWVRQKLERETSQDSLKRHHDSGFTISFVCHLTASTWPETVCETIDLAQRAGSGWNIAGAIAEEIDMSCSDSNIPGIGFIQVRTERDS
jgi:hypothetical protein